MPTELEKALTRLRAVILAGGKGRRLGPYTTIFPTKSLMPIDDIPILEVVEWPKTKITNASVSMKRTEVGSG